MDVENLCEKYCPHYEYCKFYGIDCGEEEFERFVEEHYKLIKKGE